MAEQGEIEQVVRTRLRSLRHTLGLSLDELAERTNLSPSTISRVETGKRTISLDILLPLAKALQVDLDSLLDVRNDDDVVIRPAATSSGGHTTWVLSRPTATTMAIKMRLEPTDAPIEQQVHPGHDWFFVIEGRVRLGPRRPRDHRRDRSGRRVRHHDPPRLHGHRRTRRAHHDLRPRRPTGPRPPRVRGLTASPRPTRPEHVPERTGQGPSMSSVLVGAVGGVVAMSKSEKRITIDPLAFSARTTVAWVPSVSTPTMR